MRRVQLLLATLGMLCVVGAVVLGQSAAAPVEVTRHITTAYAVPDSRFVVTLRLEATQDLAGVGIHEILPRGWTLHPLDNAGAAFKRAENAWVWSETIRAGSSRSVVYEVVIPSARELSPHPLPGCFSIEGTLQVMTPRLELPIVGESTLEVSLALPVLSAVAHLVPETKESPDAIDLRLSESVTSKQLTRAIELWQEGKPMPGTGGATLTLTLLEKLVAHYETCTPVHQPLPLGDDPGLSAVRTIDSFLPCDSVLLREGCRDPGPNARRFSVTVTLTAARDAYGVGLKESVPAGWQVRAVRHDGLAFRAATTEWIYPKRLAAGETLQVIYEVEVVSSSPASDLDSSGCCGQEGRVDGRVSSALGCGAWDVAGETAVRVWDCLPIILVISRWDVERDAFDVTLSDFITFAQVQRAVAFWLEGNPVPHTCGYAIGYETMKAIVAHWLTHTAPTGLLPAAPPGPCVGDPGCYVPADSCDWICEMRERQMAPDAAEYIGPPPSQAPIVDAGPDRDLTCLIQSVTLTGTAAQGTPPYRYEWFGPQGERIAETLSIEVRDPGTYMLVVTSEGGCQSADTVVVREDTAPPTVQASADGSLSCARREVTLTAEITGGRPLYVVEWTGPQRQAIGRTMQVAAREPGTYTVRVTGANGCSAVDTVDVMEDVAQPSVDAAAEGSLNCRVGQVVVTATVRGGTTPYAYEWRNGAGTLVGTESEIAVNAGGEYTVKVTGANGCSAQDNVTVAEDVSPPTVDAGPDRFLDCRVRQVVVQAAVSGGTPPYTYEWRDEMGTVVGTESKLTLAVAGTYAVTVVGGNGCSADDTVTVAEDASLPNVDTGPDRSLDCRVRQVVVQAAVSGGTPPYTYEWRNAAGAVVGTEDEITVDRADTITVTVCGANGCSARDTVVVVDDASAPTLDAGPDRSLDCRTRSVTLKASVSGGKPPFCYEWRTAAGAVVGTQNEIAVSSGGAYTATVTGANGCSASDTVNVVEDVSPPTVDAGPDRVLDCRTRQVTGQATVSGGTPPYTYEWRNAAGAVVGREPTLTLEIAGVYTVTVTGANGCSCEDTVRVTDDVESPVAQATVERPLTCASPETTLSAGVTGGRPPYVVEWRDPDGNPIGETMKISVARPGTYTVSVTGANGCSASAAVTVTRDVEAPQVDVTADRALTCADPEVMLTATVTGGRPPYTIEWQDARGMPVGSTESIVVREAGTYFAVVTGANGCSVSGSVVVVGDWEAPTVTATGGRSLTCAMPQTTLTADVAGGRPPYGIEWRTDRGMLLGYTRSITVSEPGTYVVTAVGANGCSASAAVTVTRDVEAPQVDVTADRALTCADAEVRLTATVTGGRPPYTIEWQNACGAIIGSTESIVVREAGTYFAVVVGANGCSVSGSVVVVGDWEAPIVTTTGGRSLTCAVPQTTLTADVTGGRPPYVVEWRTDRGLFLACARSITVTEPGTYIVTVTGANGCRATGSVTVTEEVTPPLVDVGPDRTLSCDNPSVLLDITVHGGVTPYAYRWTDDCGKEIATAEDITVTRPGLYTVVVVGANGCSASASVRVASKITSPTVDAGPDRLLTCDTPDVLLDATVGGGSAPYQYVWTDACGVVVGTAEDLWVTKPGAYTLLVRTADGCVGMDSVVVIQASD